MKDTANLCSTCYYCQRGSFPKVKIHDLKNAMTEHESVNEKPLGRIPSVRSVAELRFHSVRKEKVQEKVLFPSKKPRHAKLDLAELVKKAEESYLDFQEVSCQHLSSFLHLAPR